jgi:CO/xanthine dehydrogenase Mo-binding subunit
VPQGGPDGKSNLSRQDGRNRTSGLALYTSDIYLPGMLYAKILASPYAHAKIVRIDTSKAEALPGVRDILKYDDPEISRDNVTGVYVSNAFNILTLPGISDFYQHPMGVAVVADDEETCDRALRLIEIEWEERPFVLDMEGSLRPDAPKVMSEVVRLDETATEPNTILTREETVGDVDKGFAEADKVIEYTFKRAMNMTAGVEPLVCVAQWRGDFLDVWIHHNFNMQTVLSTQNDPAIQYDRIGRELPPLPEMLSMAGMPPNEGAPPKEGMPPEARTPVIPGFAPPAVKPTGRDKMPPFTRWSKITLTYPYQGAMFGGVSWIAYSYAFIRIAIILARRTGGKPVKLLYEESNFFCGGDEDGTYRCKVGAKKDGTITAYDWHVIGATNGAMEKTHECTGIPNIRGTQQWAFTNRNHVACWRHGAHCCVPHNVMFDHVAAEFGLDPTAVALKNDGCEGHYWDWVTQYQKENGFPRRHSLKEVLELGKKAIAWDQKWHAPGLRKLANGRMHGLGFTSINEWSYNLMGIPALPCLILRDGMVTIIGTRSDMGIDGESGFRQCVAAEIGMKYEETVIQQQRSDNNTYLFSGLGGSFGTTHTSPQLVLAARGLRRKLLQYAVTPRGGTGKGLSFFPGKKPEDLDIRDSVVFEKANPKNQKPVSEIGAAFWSTDPAIVHATAGTLSGLTSGGKPDRRTYAMCRQAHFIEVEVDTETGLVDVTNIVCVNDIGHIFNFKGAEAQQYGGAVMGLSRSATEEKVWCPRTGVALNNDLIGYHFGTMNDYPPAACFLTESHLGYSTYGACGIGEDIGASMSGITAGAVFNAVGKWVDNFPITPERVLKALGRI